MSRPPTPTHAQGELLAYVYSHSPTHYEPVDLGRWAKAVRESTITRCVREGWLVANAWPSNEVRLTGPGVQLAAEVVARDKRWAPRVFRIWLDKMFAGSQPSYTVISLPAGTSDSEAQAECAAALDTLIGNELDTGWEELEGDEAKAALAQETET